MLFLLHNAHRKLAFGAKCKPNQYFEGLHYSLVSVGTPALTFLVALDTSSELFWIPCDCINCARSLSLPSGKIRKLDIYSPSTSTTSTTVPCSSPMCGPTRGCSTRLSACSYQLLYGNTSTAGILVNDLLHLGTDTDPQDPIDAPITFGCGMVQTGEFLDGVGLNGLFGLGIGSESVPSILASKGVTANSFSMCFSRDGLGRIEFGDTGSPDQEVTPFNLQQSQPYYNVTVTQISVEESVTNVEFTAIFDTTSSFVYLSDPAYSIIVKGFDSRITEVRYIPSRRIIFDYCYSLGATQESYTIPILAFTMEGGGKFYVHAPTIVIRRDQGGLAYCLAIIESEDVNIIGRYDSISSNSPPISKGTPSSTPPPPPPSPSAFIPVANGTRTPISPPPPPSQSPPPPPPTKTLLGRGGAARLNSMSTGLVMVLLAIFALV
ncbi:PREDICTED: aspartic proteinase-like protein 1 [Erythranthe guttata]|uniref:aspartic proteinase-like protein 1 n=1 Tax=Erythranthe guttata TaxID=4155 RepID=UPI00064DB85E|nr:PREDICTED: aspartic proteinase-like protein 1 [Erythranthe guttata]|eukprot:XP_012837911.1 PREDICTED: aspartic proteinase-like protein 1 [Erythranthe guttata]